MRLISYNLEFAKSATSAEVADLLRPYSADLICFCEVPDGEWTASAGKSLGMEHCFVGDVASANHEKDYPDITGFFCGKFKSILSKTPLCNLRETELAGVGWSPVSVVLADTTIDGVEITIGSLHIPSGASDPKASCAANLANSLKNQMGRELILCGDFNDLTDSEPMEILYNDGFRNAWPAVGFDWTKAFTCDVRSGKMYGVIDHFIHKGRMNFTTAGIIPEAGDTLSDHSAIIAEINN